MKLAWLPLLHVVAVVAMLGTAQAQDKTYVMKIGIPTANNASHQFAKNFAAAVERDSGGHIKPQVFPSSQLGTIPRMIEGAQFGTIECK
jgi:TRAP-type C4-dicarboxylate transport system substrate-binding protein